MPCQKMDSTWIKSFLLNNVFNQRVECSGVKKFLPPSCFYLFVYLSHLNDSDQTNVNISQR